MGLAPWQRGGSYAGRSRGCVIFGHSRPLRRVAGRRVVAFECLERRELLAADLMITEFMASNGGTLRDVDGDTPDWIEIYNPGSAPVDLTGWTLTDDPGDYGKWEFPPMTIAPEEYIVAFASG